jgi:lipopolysaccharide/colanic/teichoic acid biosynthesis glycosyltransferase
MAFSCLYHLTAMLVFIAKDIPSCGVISLANPLVRSDFYVDAESQPIAGNGFVQSSSSAFIRFMDIAISGLAIVILAPLFVVVSLLIKLFDPGPIIFRHARIGRAGETFHCLKFRSMCVDADIRLKKLLETDHQARAEWARDHKLKDDPRISPIGRFLRKTSIDELPQLFNVLRGEMSIVGPRPIVAAEVPKYGRYFSVYCSVRPGITGLWQVSGRNDVSYRRRVAMDTVYCRSADVSLYIWIIAATVPSVLMTRGSY